MVNFSEFAWEIPEHIRSGQVAVDLVKPISLPLRYMAEQAGHNLIYLLLSLPAYLLILPFVPLRLPDLAGWGWFTLAWLLAYLVNSLLNLIVGSAAFWTITAEGLWPVVNFGMWVLSGRIIPLWYMPDWFSTLARWLPFQAAYFTPVAAFTGRLHGPDLWRALILQAAWVVALGLLTHWIWARATRKVVVHGG
jgi:ABC-type uncharacterized transport system permease subunit